MKYLLILGLGALVVAFFGYNLIFSVPEQKSVTAEYDVTKTADVPEVVTETKENKEPVTGLATLEDLRLRNEDLECALEYTDASGAQAEGTFFSSDQKIRADILTPAPDLQSQILSSFILSGDTMYVWSEIEGATYGVKFDYSETDENMRQKTEVLSLDHNVTYECKEWIQVDRTVFLPPENVLLQDMTEILQGGMEYGDIYEEQAELPY